MNERVIDPFWQFHHLGVACRDIEKDFAVWADLGYEREGEVFADQTQGIRGLFLHGAGPRLELLEDLPGRNTVAPWLEKGARICHSAYEVPNLDVDLKRLTARRARIVVEPVPAVAFGNRKICFLMLRNFSLIELIESEAR